MTLGDGMRHLADLLDEVASAVQSIVLRATPLDGGPAMSELAAEKPYRTARMQTPLANTTAYASVLGYAVCDATKAYAHHLRHPELLVWAPFVNARAGLDAAAYAFGLVEPGVGVEGRVQRGMAFRLHNAREQLRAPAELTTAKNLGTNAVASVKESAAELDWAVPAKKHRAAVGDTRLPFAKDAIDAVLSHRQNPGYESVADLSWWFYSGVTHAAPYALMQSMASDEARPTGVPGVVEVPIYISGKLMLMAAAALGRALLNLGDAYGRYLGLSLDEIGFLDTKFSKAIVEMHGAMERVPIATDSPIRGLDDDDHVSRGRRGPSC
jgi:hypothetical protein